MIHKINYYNAWLVVLILIIMVRCDVNSYGASNQTFATMQNQKKVRLVLAHLSFNPVIRNIIEAKED